MDEVLDLEELVQKKEKPYDLWLLDRGYTRGQAHTKMKTTFAHLIVDHAIETTGVIWMKQPFEGIALWEKCSAKEDNARPYWHFELY